ncbi:MAG: 23S rRNA (guanosine(2251)-2'-O)-methyltransferase RlmB, partial [Caldilineaceae bacterium]|nr:23S rRNA (guanosine(2251)-2'-O)-methyltransferase RlmB [Caldilineaceae bacterium]
MSELLYGRRAVLEALRAARRRVYRLWLEGSKEPQRTGVIGEIWQ